MKDHRVTVTQNSVGHFHWKIDIQPEERKYGSESLRNLR